MALLSDISCKQAFAFPELVKELLCAAIEQPWTHQIPIEQFERVNASYVSASGRQRHDDLVWRIRRPDGGDLYLLIEFQSRPDQRMAERMHAYTALLSEDLARQGKTQDLQILPIVLYSGRGRWHAKTSISTLPAGQAGLEDVGSQFGYLVIDRHTIQDKDNFVYTLLMLDQANPKYDDPRILASTLNFWLERQSNQDLVDTVESMVLATLHSLFPDFIPSQVSRLKEVLTMLDELHFKSYSDLLRFQATRRARIQAEWDGRRRGKELGRASGHREGHEEGLGEGLHEGRLEGRQEGLQEGHQEGRQEIFGLILGLRGTPLSSAANERLNAADPVTLRSWIEQLLKNEVPPELKD